ncbi:MAG: hypothetical protein M3N31_09275 [Actinomycetota bacterium]|nr:hypothetical protein [Actinomycetota bacterium]
MLDERQAECDRHGDVHPGVRAVEVNAAPGEQRVAVGVELEERAAQHSVIPRPEQPDLLSGLDPDQFEQPDVASISRCLEAAYLSVVEVR